MSAIFYISPDLAVRRAVQRYLTRYGYLVVPAATASEALRAAVTLAVSAVVFDTATPGEGVERFIQAFRALPGRERVPIIAVTGPATYRRLAASPLLTAADAVLQRPVRPAALLRQVERALALSGAPDGHRPLPLRLDRRRQTVQAGAHQQRLTPTELRLLACLLDHAGQVLTYGQLLEEVWGYAPSTGSPELVRTHVMNLRRKLAHLPACAAIETVPRLGYQLRFAPDRAAREDEVPPYWAARTAPGYESGAPSLTDGEAVGVE